MSVECCKRRGLRKTGQKRPEVTLPSHEPGFTRKTSRKKRKGVQTTAVEERKWPTGRWALKFLILKAFTLA